MARGGLTLIRDAGIDVGIMGSTEVCCGGRAYEMGYKDELIKYATRHNNILKKAGVETVVTPCAHCYQTMKVVYDKIGMNPGVEILHTTEYLERLINEGKISCKKRSR